MTCFKKLLTVFVFAYKTNYFIHHLNAREDYMDLFKYSYDWPFLINIGSDMCRLLHTMPSIHNVKGFVWFFFLI